jgi:hypothetical protein
MENAPDLADRFLQRFENIGFLRAREKVKDDFAVAADWNRAPLILEVVATSWH